MPQLHRCVACLSLKPSSPPWNGKIRRARVVLSSVRRTVGPVADGIILSSRRRMLALMRAGDADGVAREMEQHIGGLLFMRRLLRGSAPTGMAV